MKNKKMSKETARKMIETNVPELIALAIDTYPELNDGELKWEDFGEVQGFYIDGASSRIIPHQGKSTSTNQNIWPTEELAEAARALSKLHQWRKKVVGDWTPEWNGDIAKYNIISIRGRIEIRPNSYDWRHMSFPDEETAILFLKQHKTILNEAKLLL